jgi:hypothetical protein
MRKGVSVRDVYKIGKTIGTGGAWLYMAMRRGIPPPRWIRLLFTALRGLLSPPLQAFLW